MTDQENTREIPKSDPVVFGNIVFGKCGIACQQGQMDMLLDVVGTTGWTFEN